MLELADMDDWDIISTGGLLKSGSMSLLGRRALESVDDYNVDKTFFSCKGIDMDKGVTDGNDETASIKQGMIASAGKVYLAVDSSKFGNIAFSKICELSKLDVVITDRQPQAAWLDYFRQNGIECIYPQNP